MFKALFSLLNVLNILKFFTAEKRIVTGVQEALDGSYKVVLERLKQFEQRIADNTAHFSKAQSEIRTRLSRLEVLFADELAEKEKARDELVKQKRIKK